MKRVREDVYNEDQRQEKLEASSPTETHGQPQTIKGGLTSLDAQTYLAAVKETFQDNIEILHTFLEVMKDFRTNRLDVDSVIERIKVLFNGYKDLLLGFDTFLPKGYTVFVPEKKKPKSRVNFNEAMGLVKKVKSRFGENSSRFKRFVEILAMLPEERKSRSEVYQEVAKLFEGHKDLCLEFINFSPDSSESASAKNAAPPLEMHPRHSNKKIKLQCKLGDYSGHSDQREDGDEKLATRSAGKSMANGQPGNLKAKYNGGIRDYEKKEDAEIKSDRPERRASTTKYEGTPINELNLSKCTRITRSYRLLPKNYPVEIPSNRDKIGRMTLNDRLVSVTSGSEDHSYKPLSKNQYEEMMSKCEDDMNQADVLLESISSAIENFEKLLEKINSNKISMDTTICIEKHLPAMNLRFIERLYGENGIDVMDLFKKNVHSAVPLILTRLYQKQEEWTKHKSEFKEVWAKVNAENHDRSLDYRSFEFKQQDSKNLSTKCLLAEIKTISEKKQQGDLLTMPSSTPDFKFYYYDTKIHLELSLLINYYCEKTCATHEQSDKVMKLWMNFLEPMVGILSGSQGTKISVVNHEVEREEGEISPTENREQRKLVVNGENSLKQHVSSQNDSRVFYGNDSYYVLFRLHQILYERIHSAKKFSEKTWKPRDNTTPDLSYRRFLQALYDLLGGSIDNTKFEDECLSILGPQSYILFTLDKLIQKIVKQLLAVAADETDTKLRHLYTYESNRKPGRGFDLVYHENARALLHEANMYRIRYSSAETHLSIQLMNTENNQPEMEPGQ